MIAESDARMLEVGSQAEEDRVRYDDQVRMRELEIQRLYRVVQVADRNAYETLNEARVAKEALARARNNSWSRTSSREASTLVHRQSSLSHDASSSRRVGIPPLTNRECECPGYDRVEDLMRDELGVDGCSPAKERRYAEHVDDLSSVADSLGGSPRIQIAAQPLAPGMGTSRAVRRDGGVRRPTVVWKYSGSASSRASHQGRLRGSRVT